MALPSLGFAGSVPLPHRQTCKSGGPRVIARTGGHPNPVGTCYDRVECSIRIRAGLRPHRTFADAVLVGTGLILILILIPGSHPASEVALALPWQNHLAGRGRGQPRNDNHIHAHINKMQCLPKPIIYLECIYERPHKTLFNPVLFIGKWYTYSLSYKVMLSFPSMRPLPRDLQYNTCAYDASVKGMAMFPLRSGGNQPSPNCFGFRIATCSSTPRR